MCTTLFGFHEKHCIDRKIALKTMSKGVVDTN